MSDRRDLGANPFRRRTALALAAVGGAGLALMLLYSVFGPRPAGDASALRRSALGYGALVRLLEAEVPVRPGRGVLPAGAAPERPLLVLDPGPEQVRTLADTMSRASAGGVPVVVVLPKWNGIPDPLRPGWVTEVALRPEGHAGGVLAAALGGDPGTPPEVRRPASTGDFAGPLAAAAGATLRPDLPRPQLFRDPGAYFEPLLAAPEGVLVGRAKDLPLYVVADPDLVNVAGLGRGDNAVLAHRLLIDTLEPAAWLVKEGSYGALPPQASVWSALLRPPLAWLSLHLALVALLVTWVAAERFGRPRAAPPRVAPGKATLVDNTARLLETAGAPASSLERYLELTARRAAERLGLPAGVEGRERLHRLDRIGRRRGAGRPLRDLVIAAQSLPAERKPRRRRAVEVAAGLSAWYHEVCTRGGT